MKQDIDITALAQRMKEHAGYIIDLQTHESENAEALIYAYDQADRIFSAENVKALVEVLEKAQQYAKDRDEENQGLMLTVGRLRTERESLENIRSAAEKLVRCKGRYHSELNYRALATLFGVNTPDLPPLDGESRTITLPPLPVLGSTDEWYQGFAAGAASMRDECQNLLVAVGISVEVK